MKLLTIIGARPQFIKAAAVSRSFSNIKSINEIIVHTGSISIKTYLKYFSQKWIFRNLHTI